MRNTSTPVICVFLLVCAGVAFAQFDVGEPFDLGVGQSATVGPTGLRVGFQQIVAEGRCPIGVHCFWEGAATGLVWAESPRDPRGFFELSTSLPFPTQALFGGYIIKLVDVAPYPREGEVIDPNVYVVTVVVTGAQTLPTEDRTWGAIKALYR